MSKTPENLRSTIDLEYNIERAMTALEKPAILTLPTTFCLRSVIFIVFYRQEYSYVQLLIFPRKKVEKYRKYHRLSPLFRSNQ